MRTVPTAASLAPTAPFKLVGGDPSLDFVNTVDWTPRGLTEERLVDYDRLLEWAQVAAVLPAARLAQLRARAARSPRAAREALDAALRARSVLRRLVESVVAGRHSADAIRDFNALLRAAHAHLVLAPSRASATRLAPHDGEPFGWEWEGVDRHLESMLWPVVRAAAALLASKEAAKLRVCGSPECGWMYVDRSRNGLRRWCEMSVCGTREKSRRRAVRRHEER